MVLSDNASLFSDTLTASDVNWIPFDQLNAPLRLRAKIRYRMAEQPCTVEQISPDRVQVVFDQPPARPWSFTMGTWWWAAASLNEKEHHYEQIEKAPQQLQRRRPGPGP